MLFIESPRGVGFSYQDNDVNTNCTQNDEMTSWDNLWAIIDFFNVHSLYNSTHQNNEFYVGGLSYAGVYVPTLVQRMLHNKEQLNFNLKGMFTENGYVSAIQNVRYLPDYLYFHGMMPKTDWDFLKNCCPNKDGLATAYCDYDNFVSIAGGGRVSPIKFDDPLKSQCSILIAEYINGKWNSYFNNPYNLYQDCYAWTPEDNPFSFMQKPKKSSGQFIGHSRRLSKQAFVNQPSRINYISSDPGMGFTCYTYSAAAVGYLDWPHVRQALHIPDYVQSSNDSPNCVNQYNQTMVDETSLYEDILRNAPDNFKIMFYAGDVDTVCGLIENQLFVENLFKNHTSEESFVVKEHGPWTYSLGDQFRPQVVGYQKSYQIGSTRIELASLKGAGHTAAGDRPGPTLQLITNFVKFKLNNATRKTPIPLSILTGFGVERQPLKKQYQPFQATEPAQHSATTASSTTSPTASDPTTSTIDDPAANATTTKGAPPTMSPPERTTRAASRITSVTLAIVVVLLIGTF
uniref:Serine carboxypeptidase n=2 Tax=Steinernema glaseri TaxID=37863 RepID=A0A1I8AP78_9BILA